MNEPGKKIDLVIFDMDGVLIDSEPIYERINRSLYAELGVEITAEEYTSFIGGSSTNHWTYIRNKGNLRDSLETLQERATHQKLKTLCESKLEPMPGVVTLLDRLKERTCKIALASSSIHEQIGIITSGTGIRPYFDALFSGEDVAHSKPAPDLFLRTCDFFKIRPSACVVIEDSNNGAIAAKRAGMHCIGLSDPNHGHQDLSMADFLIPDFGEASISRILRLVDGA